MQRSYARTVLDAATGNLNTSVVVRVAPVVATCVAWSVFILVLNKTQAFVLVFEDKLVSMLGIALAFLLAFRTNRAFDRYWNGAQIWTTLSIQTRNLARQIWNGVAAPEPERMREKRQIMRMVLAVAVATKAALRKGTCVLDSKSNSQTFSPIIDDQVAELLPPGYFSVHTWRQSMANLGIDDLHDVNNDNDNGVKGNVSAHTKAMPKSIIHNSTLTESVVTDTRETRIITPRRTTRQSWLAQSNSSNKLSPTTIHPSHSELDAAHPSLVHRTPSKRAKSRDDDTATMQPLLFSSSSSSQITPKRRSVRLQALHSLQQKSPSSFKTTKSTKTSTTTIHASSSFTDNVSEQAFAASSSASNDKYVINPFQGSTHIVDTKYTETKGTSHPLAENTFIATDNSLYTSSTGSDHDTNSTTSISLATNLNLAQKHYPTYNQGGDLVINTPLEIIHRIGFYIRRQRALSLVDPEDVPTMIQAINTMIDSVTKFEQIVNVSIPPSYDIHMKHILMLYFLALPFQLIRSLGWVLVFVTLVVSFAYFGADAIASEIDAPFGTDANDLPLDYYCEKLKSDIEFIMEEPLL